MLCQVEVDSYVFSVFVIRVGLFACALVYLLFHPF